MMEPSTSYDPQLADQIYYSSNTVQIRPQENVFSNSFTGTCTFVVDIAKDEMILPQSHYLVAKANVSSTLFDATPAFVRWEPIGKPYGLANGFTKPLGCISSGGVINCFSKLSHEIAGIGGSNICQNIENLPQCNGLLRNTHEYPLSANLSGCDTINYREKCKLDSIIYPASNNIIGYNKCESQLVETPIDFIVRNAHKQNLDINREITLSSRLPIALFMQESKLYQGQHIIRLTIDQNWRQNLVDSCIATSITGEIPIVATGFNGTYLQSEDAGPPGHRIAINITDLYLYVEYVKINKRPIGKQILTYESFNCTLHNMVSGNSDNFIMSVRPHLLKIIAGFQRTTNRVITAVGNPPTNTPTALITPVGMFGFNPINLNQFRLKYLSDTYPQQDYNLSLLDTIYDNIAGGLSRSVQIPFTGNYDNARAYEDYCNALECDNSNKIMTYQQWLLNPVFVFKFCSTTNIASNLEIFINTLTGTPGGTIQSDTGAPAAVIDTGSDLSNSTLYLLYVYRSMIEVDYAEDSVNYKVFNLV